MSEPITGRALSRRSTLNPQARCCLSAAAVCLALVASACGKKQEDEAKSKEPEAAAIKVKTVSVSEREVPRFLVVTGSIKADREAEVAADATGKVLATYVERGSAVKKGQPLALLDVRTVQLTQASARLQARLAKQNLDLARLECDRAKKLFEGGSIPRAELDRRLAQCQTGESSAEIAQTGAQLAAKSVGDATLRAPFAGVVGERFVNVGQYVQPQSRVVSLYVVDPLRLELSIPEAQVGSITQGQQVDFRVAAYQDTVFTGTVEYVSPVVRARSRDLVVEAVVRNAQRDGQPVLRPGMFAEARLRVKDEKRPVVPLSAVRKGEVAASVFAVVDGRATERVVQLGEPVGDAVALLAGVKAGEHLVDAPPENLRDGARVLE